MDISVSGLNGRLASKLPPELPLGLVFVVGKVEALNANGFILSEGPHYLNCRAEGAGHLNEGDEVRASGHLMFDAEHLQYYLLARDIEIVSSEPLGFVSSGSREVLAESESLLSALAAVKARAAVAPLDKGEDLPVWVRKLAPPEVRPEAIEEDEEAAGSVRAYRSRYEKALDEDLVTLLSQAMDSDEDMELTPELLAKYMPETPEETEVEGRETLVDAEPHVQPQMVETAESLANLSTSYRPVNREDTDWLVILLIISFFILTIAAIVTIVLLLLQ